MDIAFGALLVLGLAWGMFFGRKAKAVEPADRVSTICSALVFTAIVGTVAGVAISFFGGQALLICAGAGAGMAIVSSTLSFLVGYFV